MSKAAHEAALRALHEAEAALAAAERAEVSTPADEPVAAPVAVAEAASEPWVAPPADDAHVAPGSSLFSDPTKKAPEADIEPAVKAKWVDLGPQYLGPVAINGT